ncbi:MAG: hypothetical protein A2559_06365 [Deltaproteobacteria bacterium RIFOXYD2_FULL_66_9]|nr:MAG: hypothetical protein A2559_06365 [Deltaproteobacteria bacterium RIFOXYD2_FULL_66_9]
MTKIGGKGMAIVVAVVLLAGVGSVAYSGVLTGLFKKSPAEIAKAAGVVETPDAVRIPLKALDSGKALFLTLESGGRQLHFFALKSRDGAYRAALDACDVCYRTNRGYRQEADQMVCNNCGQKFAGDKIGEVKGGCNPHPLARGIEGRNLVIRKSDIAAGKDYFAGKRS